jgi:hypothetical protein
MPKPDVNLKRPTPPRFDVEGRPWIDQAGRNWSLSVDLVVKGGVVGIGAFAVKPVGHNEPLTGAVLRGINLRDIAYQERQYLIDKGLLACDPQDDRLLSDAEVEDLMAFGGPARGRELTELDLRLVARLYADAYREGLPVQRTVAEHLGVSIPTAARRIMLARDRGLIGSQFSQTRGARKTQRGRVHSNVE